jgi:hypothetical protein
MNATEDNAHSRLTCHSISDRHVVHYSLWRTRAETKWSRGAITECTTVSRIGSRNIEIQSCCVRITAEDIDHHLFEKMHVFRWLDVVVDGTSRKIERVVVCDDLGRPCAK